MTLRGGVKDVDYYYVMHGASGGEGLRMAKDLPDAAENENIQRSLRGGNQHVVIFKENMPPAVVRYLKELGNRLNNEQCATTFTEVPWNS